MAFKMRRKQNVNVIRVGMKIAVTVIGLYASGYLVNAMFKVVNNTHSPFYGGFSMIGWTTTSTTNFTIDGRCGATVVPTTGTATVDCINSNTGSSGILAIVGLLAIVWIVFEFVDISM